MVCAWIFFDKLQKTVIFKSRIINNILDAKGFVFDSATAVQTIAKDPTWEDMVIFKYIFERSNTYMHVAYIDDNFVYLFYKFR